MTDADDAPFSELLAELDSSLADPVDFTATDPEMTAAKVRHLTATATYFNVLAVTDFGGRIAPARDMGLVEQVIGAAVRTYAGEDPHPTSFEKAAMLLRGITQGHPFYDGNKRTGFLVAAYYLGRVGYPLPAALPVENVVRLCLRVSAGELRDIHEIAQMLRQLWHETSG